MPQAETQSVIALANVKLAPALPRPSPAAVFRRSLRAVATRFDRSRRVILLLAAVWVLNGFDLCFTMLEANGSFFRELNPMAARLLSSPYALVTYKLTLVFLGSVVLIKHRTLRIAELGCWFLLATYSYLWIRWAEYYDHVTVTLSDPCIVGPVLGQAGH